MPVHSRGAPGIQRPVPLFRLFQGSIYQIDTVNISLARRPLSGRKIVFETAKDYHLADALWLILCMFPARLFLQTLALTLPKSESSVSNSVSELRTYRKAFR